MKLRDQLIKHLQISEVVASGELQRIYWPKYAYGVQKGYHTPRSVVRRLEELAEEGKINVEYIKGHAHYSLSPEKRKKVQVVEDLGDAVRVSYKEVPLFTSPNRV